MARPGRNRCADGTGGRSRAIRRRGGRGQSSYGAARISVSHPHARMEGLVFVLWKRLVGQRSTRYEVLSGMRLYYKKRWTKYVGTIFLIFLRTKVFTHTRGNVSNELLVARGDVCMYERFIEESSSPVKKNRSQKNHTHTTEPSGRASGNFHLSNFG